MTDKIPATLAGTSLSTTLKNKLGTIQGGATTDQIYVFTDATSFSQFFAVYPAKPTTNAGFTLNVGTAQSKTYVAPFENASLPVGGYSALTMEQLPMNLVMALIWFMVKATSLLMQLSLLMLSMTF